MKINILKEKLAKALSVVEKISGRNLTLPILNNVLLSAEDNFLKLSTTDLEIGINYWVASSIEKKGQFTVPVRPFSALISLLEEDKIEIEKRESTLILKGKSHKTQIKGIEAKDFPIIPEVSKDCWLEFDGPALCQSILQVIDFTAITQTRPELSGIYFSFEGNSAKIVATDSFRLAEKNIRIEETSQNSQIPASFILPRNTARELVSIFSQDGKIRLYLSGGQIMAEKNFREAKHPQAQLVSRLVEGDYPNYQEVIPKEHKTRIILDRERFLNHIKTASLFSGKSNEIKLASDQKKDTLVVFSQNTDVGESKSSINAKIEGEETETSFNYKFLSEGLGQIRTKEVIFELNGQEGPGALKPFDEVDYIYVIMPIKAS
jgi:DNA polymerase III subunit beta